MREPEDRWVRALRDLTGNEADTIRYNTVVDRWEFVIAGADGVPRSQFWCWFDRPRDPVSGLCPRRELDDDAMREVLRNLTVSFVGNPHDGAGLTRREVMKRHRTNRDEGQRRWKEAGLVFSDMAWERRRRLRGDAFSGYGGSLGQASRKAQQDTIEVAKIEVVTPIGAKVA